MTRITLDFPPSANRYWRIWHNRAVRTKEAEEYKEHARLICLTAGIEPLEGDLSVRLTFYRPAKRGDLDNRIKITLDSLQGLAYNDDNQVAELYAIRHDDKRCPRVIVEVTKL